MGRQSKGKKAKKTQQVVKKQKSFFQALGGSRLALPADLPAVKPNLTSLGAEQAAAYVRGDSDHVNLTKEMSSEQVALQRARVNVAALITRDPGLASAMVSMITMRRCYAVAYRDIKDRLAALAKDGTSVDAMAETLIVQAAMHKAAEPFNEHQLMQDGVIGGLLPWIGGVIDSHSASDDKEEQEASRAAAEARRSMPIHLGFKHSPFCDEASLQRDCSLVLVGKQEAVSWLIDRIITETIPSAGKPTIVYFMTNPPQHAPHFQVVRIPPAQWRGCCNTNKAFALVMGERVADKLTYQPDLVVCEHLPDTYTTSLFGRYDGAVAGDAHAVARRWCDKAGCAFLGGIARDDDAMPDLTDPQFENLRTFTFLRGLEVLDSGEGLLEGCRRIRMENGCQWDVPRDELERFAKRTIVAAEASVA